MYEPLVFSENDNTFNRVVGFIGHYDLRVYVSDKAYIDVGRCSMEAALWVTAMTGDFEGCAGTVGQMCNFAPCELLAGGEHWNDLPVNVMLTLPNLLEVSRSVPTLNPRPPKPFSIGNAVLVSSGGKVLAGTQIGDGAVLGAGAVAAGTLEPFGIYGGVPAKLIRLRLDEKTRADVEAVRWWDFDYAYLKSNVDRLQELAVDRSAAHVYRKPRPRLVMKIFKRGPGSYYVEIFAFIADGTQHSITEAPAKVLSYLAQMSGPGPYYWLADMWAD